MTVEQTSGNKLSSFPTEKDSSSTANLQIPFVGPLSSGISFRKLPDISFEQVKRLIAYHQAKASTRTQSNRYMNEMTRDVMVLLEQLEKKINTGHQKLLQRVHHYEKILSEWDQHFGVGDLEDYIEEKFGDENSMRRNNKRKDRKFLSPRQLYEQLSLMEEKEKRLEQMLQDERLVHANQERQLHQLLEREKDYAAAQVQVRDDELSQNLARVKHHYFALDNEKKQAMDEMSKKLKQYEKEVIPQLEKNVRNLERYCKDAQMEINELQQEYDRKVKESDERHEKAIKHLQARLDEQNQNILKLMDENKSLRKDIRLREKDNPVGRHDVLQCATQTISQTRVVLHEKGQGDTIRSSTKIGGELPTIEQIVQRLEQQQKQCMNFYCHVFGKGDIQKTSDFRSMDSSTITAKRKRQDVITTATPSL